MSSVVEAPSTRRFNPGRPACRGDVLEGVAVEGPALLLPFGDVLRNRDAQQDAPHSAAEHSRADKRVEAEGPCGGD